MSGAETTLGISESVSKDDVHRKSSAGIDFVVVFIFESTECKIVIQVQPFKSQSKPPQACNAVVHCRPSGYVSLRTRALYLCHRKAH